MQQAQLTAVVGVAQTGRPGTQLPQPVVVALRELSGAPVQGALIEWHVIVGTGTVSPATPTTDASGQARASWILGPHPGMQQLRAYANGTFADIQATAVTPYTKVPLNGLSSAAGLNNRRQVVGMTAAQGAIWDNGVLTLLPPNLEPAAINDSGHVAGAQGLTAVLWRHDSVIAIPLLPQTIFNYAVDLNAKDEVVGVSYFDTFKYFRQFLWSGGVVRDVGSGWAAKINASTHVLGLDGYQGTLWRNGRISTLLGGVEPWPGGLNDSDVVVGETGPVGFSSYNHAFIWANGAWYDLGTAGREGALASGVSNSGLIVGTSIGNGPGPIGTYPFVIDQGALMELDSVPGGGARAVNDSGDVLGYTLVGTQTSPVLWVRHP